MLVHIRSNGTWNLCTLSLPTPFVHNWLHWRLKWKCRPLANAISTWHMFKPRHITATQDSSSISAQKGRHAQKCCNRCILSHINNIDCAAPGKRITPGNQSRVFHGTSVQHVPLCHSPAPWRKMKYLQFHKVRFHVQDRSRCHSAL